MKNLPLWLLLVAIPALANDRQSQSFNTLQALNGSPSFLGTVTATTVKDNSNTSSTFTITGGSLLMVQCDAASYLLTASSAAAATLTSTNGVRVEAYEKFYLMLLNKEQWLQALAVTGTINCKVWRMQ